MNARGAGLWQAPLIRLVVRRLSSAIVFELAATSGRVSFLSLGGGSLAGMRNVLLVF